MQRFASCTCASTLLFAMTTILAAADRPGPEDFEGVRTYLEEQVQNRQVPSVAVGVVARDGVIWAEGFGFADVKSRTPATADTTYWLASVSKPITATGLMRLVDLGKIELDKPANDYLPGAKLRAYVGSPDAMTVRRLANHTSGLPVHHNFFYDGPEPPPRDQSIARFGFAVVEPGSRWQYSNFGFGVLDYITETVSGQSWSKYMEDTVYDPLGMTRTSDHPRPGHEADAAVQYNKDLAGRWAPVTPYRFDHPGASAVQSSVNDLARFVRMHMNDGELEGTRVLKPESARAMRERTSRRDGPVERGTGIGWAVETTRGHKAISHTGGMPGAATLVRIFPDDGLAIIILINAGGAGPVTRISDRILDVLFPGTAVPPQDERADGDRGDRAGPDTTTEGLGDWKGAWVGRIAHHDGDIPLKLEVGSTTNLKVQLGDAGPLTLANPSLSRERLRGAVEGWLGAQPNYHGATEVVFELERSGDRLRGVVHAEQRWYFNLPFFAELTRETKPSTAVAAASAPRTSFDVLIKNGRIVDGCGTPWYRADLGITDGKVSAIGRLADAQAKRTIDAKGLVVAPGFLDLMGQTATPFLDDPRSGDNLLTQGITTINCGEGGSDAPLDERAGANRGWRTMAEYFARLDAAGMPLNVVQTVGHTQVRTLVLGDVDRKATPEELERMKSLVAESMDAGAIGLSTSLIYPPAVYAPTTELIALAQVAAERGGRYFTHMRNEGDRLLEAIDEALQIGRESGAPVHIFHLKAAGRRNWGKMDLALARITAARAAGQQVGADIYPYINNGLSLRSFIHPRHAVEGEAALLRKLDDPAVQAEIRKDLEGPEEWENWYRHIGMDWNNVVVAGMTRAPYEGHSGKTLAEVARAVGKGPWEVFYELCGSSTFALPKTMTEANLIKAMRQEFVCFDTDVGPAGGSLIAKHPRAFGAFPRVLGRFTRDLGILSLEVAIQRMTAVAANELGLHDRGRLLPGLAADIVVFDADRFRDRATLAEPGLPSEGACYVLVNGQIVLDDGKPTEARPGRVLRGPGHRRP